MREFDKDEVICDRYVILDRPLAGGQAFVYQALDTKDDDMQIVALKLLQQLHDEEAVKRFEHEADTHIRLVHPNIVRMLDKVIYSSAKNQDITICVLEWIDGGCSLESMLEDYQGKFPLSLFAKLMAETADGVAYGHAQRLVHRDLKPSNVLVDVSEKGEPTAKVADFGLVKLLDSSVKLTKTMCTVGTPLYMSPGQGLGSEFAPGNDIYSFGAMGYHLLTGQPPYETDELSEWPKIWRKVIQGELTFASIASLRPDVPEALQVLIGRCLDPIADSRPSMHENARFMRQLWHELSSQATATQLRMPVPSSHPPPKHSPEAVTIDPIARTMHKIAAAKQETAELRDAAVQQCKKTMLGLGFMLPPKAAVVEVKSEPAHRPATPKSTPMPLAKPAKMPVKAAEKPSAKAGVLIPRASSPAKRQSSAGKTPSGRVSTDRPSVPKVVVATSQANTSPVAITQKTAVAPTPVARPVVRATPSQATTVTSIKVSRPSSSMWLFGILALLLVGVAVAVWLLPMDLNQPQSQPSPSSMQAAEPFAPTSPTPSTTATAAVPTAYVPRPPSTRPVTRLPVGKGKPRTGSTSDGIVVEGLPPGTPPPLDNP